MTQILLFDKYSIGSQGKIAIRADKILVVEDFGDKVRIDFAVEYGGNVRSIHVSNSWESVYSAWVAALKS